MSDPPGDWSPLPRSPDAAPREPAEDEIAPETAALLRVVGLGAICDLGQSSTDGRSQSFAVSEFALLDDGRRVILHRERGVTLAWGSGFAIPGDISTGASVDSITQLVLDVVLPDDDDEGDHPWPWLAELARARGLDVSAEDLQRLPYHVVLTDSVARWLPASTT